MCDPNTSSFMLWETLWPVSRCSVRRGVIRFSLLLKNRKRIMPPKPTSPDHKAFIAPIDGECTTKVPVTRFPDVVKNLNFSRSFLLP